MTQPSPFLKTREWIIIIFYCGLMCAITLVTQVIVPKERPEFQHEHSLKSNTIEVSISGAVKSPGLYIVQKGATTKELIELAGLLSSADISKINLNAHLTKGRHIKIPTLEMVTIRIDGEVETSVTIKVPKGTKLKELFDVVAFTNSADSNAILKQRAVRDGETVTIPKKKGKPREKYCKKT